VDRFSGARHFGARFVPTTVNVIELVHDPWRAQQMAMELEREGMNVVAFPQSPARLIPASDRLYRA